MAIERLYQFPNKVVPVGADLIYMADSANNFNEVNVTVADLLSSPSSVVNIINNVVLSYNGNPNGNVAGLLDQLLWDTADDYLWICVTAGTATSSVWTNISTVPDMVLVQVPLTGFAITIPNGVKTLILNPAGTLSAGSITTPSTPYDTQEIRILTSQTISTLTMVANAGQSLANAYATTLTAGTGIAYIYNLASTTWFRLY